eukprot:NODE_4192_length_1210_cov_17.906164_g3694_i0.p1 GENE.NODE_4192_length_1210_cov_17.906164_g3694_i0~~NODE_4192_length_1210_cov_17.906164_g3694_i0.p1  ORF type:complete len:382 (-),score=43.38 NODE_4192_length_1210_cov_17.906164_g3694_i0:64-1050(-)
MQHTGKTLELKVPRPVNVQTILDVTQNAFSTPLVLFFAQQTNPRKHWRRMPWRLPSSTNQEIHDSTNDCKTTEIVPLNEETLEIFMSFKPNKQILLCEPLFRADTPLPLPPSDNLKNLKSKLQSLEEKEKRYRWKSHKFNKSDEIEFLKKVSTSPTPDQFKRTHHKGYQSSDDPDFVPKRSAGLELRAHETEIVEKLYTEGIKRKSEIHDKIRQKWIPQDKPSEPPNRDELNEIVRRLYYNSLKNSEELNKESEEKFSYKHPESPKRTPDEEQEIIRRLYKEGLDSYRSRMKRASEYYKQHSSPARRPMTDQEWETVRLRLCRNHSNV